MMDRKQEILLSIDGIVNLALGVLLLLFPFGTAKTFGVPQASTNFYPTILCGYFRRRVVLGGFHARASKRPCQLPDQWKGAKGSDHGRCLRHQAGF